MTQFSKFYHFRLHDWDRIRLKYMAKLLFNPTQFSLMNTTELPLDTTQSKVIGNVQKTHLQNLKLKYLQE